MAGEITGAIVSHLERGMTLGLRRTAKDRWRVEYQGAEQTEEWTDRALSFALVEVSPSLAAKDAEVARLREALGSALDYQVANSGSSYEFYKCRTPDKMPEWVHLARRALEVGDG